MKKVMIGIGMVGLLLVSLASAGLVDFLSNTVTGEVVVSGPVFYLDKTDIMGDGSFSLKMNKDNVLGTYFELTAGDTDSKEFFSERLGVDGFYPMKFEVDFDTKVTGINESDNESGVIHIRIDLVRENGNFIDYVSNVCDVLYLWNDNDRYIHTIECDAGDSLVDINPTDRLKVLLNDGSPSNSVVTIWLGDSKLQMVAK